MAEAPAPKRFPDRDLIAAVRAEAEPLEDGAEAATTRRVAGRAMARRGMGKLVFLDVVDRSGRIQAICDVAATGEVDVHLGDVVGIVGRPGERAAVARLEDGCLDLDEAPLVERTAASTTPGRTRSWKSLSHA